MAETHASNTSQRLAELSELAGGLAHELRNPLSTMMINLTLLAEELREPTSSIDEARGAEDKETIFHQTESPIRTFDGASCDRLR